MLQTLRTDGEYSKTPPYFRYCYPCHQSHQTYQAFPKSTTYLICMSSPTQNCLEKSPVAEAALIAHLPWSTACIRAESHVSEQPSHQGGESGHGLLLRLQRAVALGLAFFTLFEELFRQNNTCSRSATGELVLIHTCLPWSILLGTFATHSRKSKSIIHEATQNTQNCRNIEIFRQRSKHRRGRLHESMTSSNLTTRARKAEGG